MFFNKLHNFNYIIFKQTTKYFFIFLLIACVLLSSGLIYQNPILQTIGFGFIIILLTFSISKHILKNDKYLLDLTILSILSVMIHFGLTLVFNFVLTNFGVDSVKYLNWGIKVAEMLCKGVPFNDIPKYDNSYSYIVGVLFYLFDVNRIMFSFLNAFIIIISGLIVYKTVLISKFNMLSARLSVVLIWFFPSFLIWSSDLLKDSFVLFFTSLSFLFLAMIFYKKSSYKYFLIIPIILFIYLSSTIRFYMFIPISIGFVGGLFIYILKSKKGKVFSIIVLSIVLLCNIVIFNTNEAQSYFGNTLAKSVEKLNILRQNGFSYDDAGLEKDISTIDKLMKALPSLLKDYLLQPTPKHWFSLDSIIVKLTIPEMISWYISLIFIFVGLIIKLKNKEPLSYAIAVYLLILWVSNAIVVGNIGAIYRYRMQFQAFAFIFIGEGFICLKNKYIDKYIKGNI
ncbi:phospholipid carrier-dependent glycosyltransferase [Crassaminicella indica]|uniref:Phospholipid carrier-dependent glycosyltransferase n=1 Tax=Crassaminicella indica TaxID=2855394 RepID=A0ABX8RCB1_9CLOT|nr:phospholipid carrier-dependent glycosyltransferase [Crassaminicella indica]QXM06687.1 phospholipid carrier-dependent glycosyltransferase [Crassaminicella indica]